VFRDCADCPELVVIVAPSASETAAVGDGTTDAVDPASFDGAPRPFAIGRFEVTFAEWDACVSDGGCTHSPADEAWGRDALPVINVSHTDIHEQFLPWLSRRAGARYRLPTAAEWEQAAGDAGLSSTGNACEMRNAAVAESCDDGFEHTSPAGALKPNAAGIYDMYGNVWEWVADCWTPGFSDAAKKEPGSCEQRKLRGGSWSSTPTVMADGGRGWELATRKRNSIGFRVARDLP
jgi:formylglycine-generating enzyme required for sulfatase activity